MARSGEMALHEHAMALSGSAFTLITYGDQGRGQSAFEQSLPLFREAGDPLRRGPGGGRPGARPR